MKKNFGILNDVIDPEIAFEFQESSEITDNESILAKVRGVFFCPDGISRNKRFYPKALWEKVIKNESIQEKLKNRTMFGTIGHKTVLDDEALQEGKVSHIVTNIEIDEKGRGIGEALILNTPAGKVLNTVLRAGSAIFVSSRADGRFKSETKRGMPVVDEDNFNLKGWDFVLDPGFLEARPELAEALKNIDNEDEGDEVMDKALERVMSENFDLKNKLNDTLGEKKSLEESLKPLEEENAHVKEQLATAEEKIKELEESVKTVSEERVSLEEKVKAYEELADSPEEMKEALETSVNYVDKIHEDLGTYEEIKEALETSVAQKEEYDNIGTPEEIKEALQKADELVDEKLASEKADRIKKLAETCKVDESKVEKLIEKDMADEDIIEFFKDMVKVEESKDDKFKKKTDGEVIDESAAPTTSVHKSRLQRLINY